METLKIYKPEQDDSIKKPEEFLSNEELDKIFNITDLDLENQEQNLRHLAESSPKNFIEAVFLLSGYDADYGIQVPQEYKESFLYQRNLKEVDEIKPELYKILTQAKEGMRLDEIDFNKISRIFAIQKRKADWLELEHYPQLFSKSEEHAVGDVNRFLLDFKNRENTEALAYPDTQEDLNVLYKDRLNYLLEKNPPESAAVISGTTIRVSLDTSFGEEDQWKVYNILVHEMVHKVSFHEFRRLGIRDNNEDPNREEINEAITEIVTAGITSKQFEIKESGLQGQSKIEMHQRAYFKYILVVQNIFKKIPQSYFVDAMMTEDGVQILEKEFEKEYGSSEALTEFATNLSQMYLPQRPPAEIYDIADYLE